MSVLHIDSEDYRGRAAPGEDFIRIPIPPGTTHVRTTIRGQEEGPPGQPILFPVPPGRTEWLMLSPEALDKMMTDPNAYVWADGGGQVQTTNEDGNDVR